MATNTYTRMKQQPPSNDMFKANDNSDCHISASQVAHRCNIHRVESRLPLLDNSNNVVVEGGTQSNRTFSRICTGDKWIIIPEVDELQGQRNPCELIHPVEAWDVFVTILLVLLMYRIPYCLSMTNETTLQQTRSWQSADFFVTAIFTIDLLLHFRLSFKDQKSADLWERNSWIIARRYMSLQNLSFSSRQGWFWIDLTALLPGWLHLYLFITTGNSHSNFLKVLEICRMVRLYRNLTMQRMTHVLQRIQAFVGISHFSVDMLKLCFVMTLCSHFQACVWLAIEGKVMHGALSGLLPEAEQTWLSALREAKGDPCIPAMEQNPVCAYNIAFYFTTMTLTTVGYGDVTPQNQTEYMLCSASMLVSGIVWTYIIGSLVALLSNLDPFMEQYKQNMDELNRLMSDRHLSPDLKVRLRRFMQESHAAARHKSEAGFLHETISVGLQTEIANQSMLRLLNGVYWADNFEKEARMRLVQAFNGEFYGPHEVMPVRGSTIHITRGLVSFNARLFRRGDTWGVESILMESDHLVERSQPRTMSYVHIMRLTRDALHQVALVFPSVDVQLRRHQIRSIVRRAMLRQASLLKASAALQQGRVHKVSDYMPETTARTFTGRLASSGHLVDHHQHHASWISQIGTVLHSSLSSRGGADANASANQAADLQKRLTDFEKSLDAIRKHLQC